MYSAISLQNITQHDIVNIYRHIKYVAIDFMHVKGSLDRMGKKSHDVLLGKSSHVFLILSVDKSRPCVLFGWFRPGKKYFLSVMFRVVKMLPVFPMYRLHPPECIKRNLI